MKHAPANPGTPARRLTFIHVLLLLALILAALFIQGILPGRTVFANDGPLGAVAAAPMRPPSSFLGLWHDLNWIGTNNGALPLGVTGFIFWLLGPLLFSKVFAPFAMLFAGLSAWFCFRQMKFSPWACAWGGIAAALNADFFNTAAWGVAGQVICFGLNYLALGALADLSGSRRWAKVMLAGMAVGLGVIEGSDIGALFSVVVAVFVVVQSFAYQPDLPRKFLVGGCRVFVVAGCAGLIAAAALSALIATQIKGVVGMSQDEATKAQRWIEATQYSIPKREALGVLIPGLFGLRFDTADGGAYWGTAGSYPAWDDYLKSDHKGPPPGAPLRAGAGSTYAGWLVLLGAAWAVLQSFRGQNSFFAKPQRIMIWFWLAAALGSLLLLFGRFAPFYKLFYALPYTSTIRNPAKFLHVLEWSLILLAGYGWHSLATLYLEKPNPSSRGLLDQFKQWRKSVSGFERNWFIGSLVGLGVAVLGWFTYAAARGKVEAYVAELSRLTMLRSPEPPDMATLLEAARATVGFSLGQVFWAVLFFGLGVVALTQLMTGYYAGKRAGFAGIALCAILALDLGWQDREWVRTWNWQEKYVQAGNNPVFDVLRQKPYEHRVSQLPPWLTSVFRVDPRMQQAEQFLESVYGSEWTQHLLLYNNIQALDIVQMPRRPVEYEAFEQALQFDGSTNTLHSAMRRWQLANARYLVGTAPLVNLLNQAFDPEKQRFKSILLFELYQQRQGGAILTRTNATGPFALIEFSGALPRARLYSNWQVSHYDPAQTTAWVTRMRQHLPRQMTSAFDLVSTNDLATLAEMTSANFDPEQTVLLAEPLTAVPPSNAPPGTVEFSSYAPKHVVLKTKSSAPQVLLLNDKYDPGWEVTVDGTPTPLLRCNYVMRGVYLAQPGEHTVEFKFSRPLLPFYISVTTIILGLALLLLVNLPRRGQAAESAGLTT